MPKKHFSADEAWNVGIEAKCDAGYRTLVYSGSLGGGTLSISTNLEGVTSPVPDGKLTSSTVDSAGQTVQQVAFSTSGNVIVTLSGSAAPNLDVAVL